MPYSTWITTEKKYGRIQPKAEQPAKSSATLCDRSTFDKWMQGLRATQRPDGSLWAPSPHEPTNPTPRLSVMPWPRTGPVRHIELSVSYSTPDMLDTTILMYQVACLLADALEARAFEEAQGRELTGLKNDRLIALLYENSRIAQLVAGTWQRARDQVQTFTGELHAPLEVPIGPLDTVSEYFLFVLTGARWAEFANVEPPPHLDMLGAPGKPLLFVDQETDSEATAVASPGRGDLIFRPTWSGLAFPRQAAITMEVVQLFKDRLGGDVRFLDRPVTDELWSWLKANTNGLGVQFYDALQAL